jgi:hypothetical protein
MKNASMSIKNLAVSSSRTIFFYQYTGFYSMKLWLKYACTDYYQNMPKTERLGEMLKLTNLYFSHSFHCEVPNSCFHSILTKPVTTSILLAKFHIACDVHPTTLKAVLHSEGGAEVSSEFEKSYAGRRPNSSEPHAANGPRAVHQWPLLLIEIVT